MFYLKNTPKNQIFGEWKITKGLKSTPISELYRFQNLRAILSVLLKLRSTSRILKISTRKINCNYKRNNSLMKITYYTFLD